MLTIRLFGGLSLERDGQKVAYVPSRRVQDLLAYLLLNRRTLHAREQLAGLFWCDADMDRARHSLNTTLWRLKGILTESWSPVQTYLRLDSRYIGFNIASNCWLDVAEFEQRCDLAEEGDPGIPERRAAIFRQAIDVYQGDLLPDCFEDWCLVERERLQCRYLRALNWLVSYHRERNDYDVAIPCALRILACDPVREDVHRDVMAMYLATQQPSLALRQYRTCEATIRKEFGADVMPETKALVTSLMLKHRVVPNPEAEAARRDLLPAVGNTARQQGLGAGLSRLHHVAALMDRACSQLDEARAELEEVMSDGNLVLANSVPDGAYVVRKPRSAPRLHGLQRRISRV
jgi:DNA-binding SARP family transcriptional activator